jgi:hypothetical protein
VYTADRWLIITALAASLLGRAAGASAAEERIRANDSAPAASDSMNMAASDSMNVAVPGEVDLYAPSIGEGIEIGHSGPNLAPYFIGGGVVAALAITQIEFGGGRGRENVGGANALLPGASEAGPAWPALEQRLPRDDAVPRPEDWPSFKHKLPPGEPLPGPNPPTSIKDPPPPGPFPISIDDTPSLPVQVVPEPGTLILYGGALLSFLGLRAIHRR